MSPLTSPLAGDIVVRPESQNAHRVYVLHMARGADQILHRTREAAIAQAVSFARRSGVRVWLETDSRGYSLVADFTTAGQV